MRLLHTVAFQKILLCFLIHSLIIDIFSPSLDKDNERVIRPYLELRKSYITKLI